jgi:hypothetical protein
LLTKTGLNSLTPVPSREQSKSRKTEVKLPAGKNINLMKNYIILTPSSRVSSEDPDYSKEFRLQRCKKNHFHSSNMG